MKDVTGWLNMKSQYLTMTFDPNPQNIKLNISSDLVKLFHRYQMHDMKQLQMFLSCETNSAQG